MISPLPQQHWKEEKIISSWKKVKRKEKSSSSFPSPSSFSSSIRAPRTAVTMKKTEKTAEKNEMKKEDSRARGKKF